LYRFGCKFAHADNSLDAAAYSFMVAMDSKKFALASASPDMTDLSGAHVQCAGSF
jgi:hypothetical protein